MARLLAFDYGTKRIGIAETDDGQIIASGLETLSPEALWPFLDRYLAAHKVEAFVVGDPSPGTTEKSQAAQGADAFCEKLRKRYPTIALHRADERLTSRMAFQAMIDGGLGKKARRNKATIDKVSAVLILQGYLESRR